MPEHYGQKEDWYPITPSAAKIQIEWCANKPTNNVRARTAGERKWKVLAEEKGVSAKTADFVGMSMMNGDSKYTVVYE